MKVLSNDEVELVCGGDIWTDGLEAAGTGAVIGGFAGPEGAAIGWLAGAAVGLAYGYFS